MSRKSNNFKQQLSLVEEMVRNYQVRNLGKEKLDVDMEELALLDDNYVHHNLFDKFRNLSNELKLHQTLGLNLSEKGETGEVSDFKNTKRHRKAKCTLRGGTLFMKYW